MDGDPWEKGERLAGRIAAQRTLLVLDGLEPMQAEAGDHALRGAIKDPALRTLLECLAHDNPGLCLVTTREPLVDLADLDGVSDRPLDELSPVACRALLRLAGVAGSNRALEAAAGELGHHALAMHLLGTWLRGCPGSDVASVAKLPRLEELPVEAGRHPRRVMEAWADRFLARGDERALELLGVLGLFDRPVDRAALVAVLKGDRVPWLNGRLWRKGSAVFDPALATLRASRLVVPVGSQRQGARDEFEIDTHPLVREHFGARLLRLAPTAWRTGHERLYRHFAGVAAPFPETLPDLEPLFRAVTHGCAAGLHREAWHTIYRMRIRRFHDAHTLHRLGAFAADLAVLAGFFTLLWETPRPELGEGEQAWALSEAGFVLRALGRLPEAAPPMEGGMVAHVRIGSWMNAATDAGNLAQLLVVLGRLNGPSGAVERARQAVTYADRSGTQFERLSTRTTLADALHQSGVITEAQAQFVEAARFEARQYPDSPVFSSLPGYQYGDMLMTRGQFDEARSQGERSMVVSTRKRWLLDAALDHLLLGRAALATASGPDDADFAFARSHFDAAVTGLRKAGAQEFIAHGLLHRAALHRLAANWPAARRDLDEAHRIASRGGMRLHLADHLLESARLHLATGDHTAARAAYTTARDEITAMGYHRRDPELAELATALDGHER